jgi:hypothetical protein
MRIMLAAIIVAIVMVVLALHTPSSVAQSSKGLAGEMSKTQREPKKKYDDKDYKSAIDRLPDQKYDPWRNIR